SGCLLFVRCKSNTPLRSTKRRTFISLIRSRVFSSDKTLSFILKSHPARDLLSRYRKTFAPREVRMRYRVLATDYDGTLAHHGRVDEATRAGLERLRATGRKLVMVTGRELPDLFNVFPHGDLFEWIVAENGALLYRPSDKLEKALAEPPPAGFADA